MLGYDFNHKLHRCERGVVMVFFAILLPLLFGFMGLSLDAGLAYVEHGKMQDIADAAALAGAAHLSDEDRDTTVKDAVKAYVEANGITLGDNDLVKKADDSAWNTKETLAKGKDSIVAWGIVTVTKDGETKDRVRVRITKRVPVVFLSMVEGIANNMVVSAKAAAEGMGEEVQLTAEDPGIIAFGDLKFLTTNIHDRNDQNNAKGYGSDLYAGGRITVDGNGKSQLKLAGNYYAPAASDGIKIVNQGNKNEYMFTQIKPSDLSVSINKKVSDLKTECINILSKKDSSKYKVVDNCTPTGEEGNKVAIINNAVLGNSTKIDNLIINIEGANSVVLDTNGITFGNVYINGNAYIEGVNNMFTGRLYGGTELNLFGDNNTYTQMISQTVNVGKGYYEHGNGKFSSSFNNIKNTFTEDVGTGSAGSGNSNSSITTGSLRLVE